jgi:peroxiredoxin Q/BCP
MKFKIILAAIVVAFVGMAILGGKRPYETHGMNGTSSAGDFASLIGKPAPDFTLQSYSGQTVHLSSLRGKKVVLFFNEGIMCYPACWNQIAVLGTDKNLNNGQVVTASIVTDGPDEWTAAIRKMPELGKETILLDTDQMASNAYGMLSLPSSMHKGMKPGHTYVIVDQNGIVRYTYDDPKMGIQNDRLVNEIKKL